jgi:hypothetical protein
MAKEQWGCSSGSPREPPFTSYGTSFWRIRASSLTYYRIGWTSVCSDGAVAPDVGQVHGQARCPEVEKAAVPLRQRSQMMRTQGIMTTFSAFFAWMMGKPLPIVWDHEASMALTPTCRSSGWLRFKGNRPPRLRSQDRRQRVAFTEGRGGQVYLIESRWSGSVR